MSFFLADKIGVWYNGDSFGGGKSVTLQQQIDMALTYSGMTKSELSKRLGYATPQAFQKRYTTGKFTKEELERIAEALGCKYISCFRYPDGKEI